MKDIEQLMQKVQDIYLEVNKSFKRIIEADPAVTRYDTCLGLLHLLSKINQIFVEVNQIPVEERAKVFNITYNAATYTSDIASIIRKSNYSFQVIKPLMDSVLSIQANIILQDVKYLDKRTRLYLDICQIYEENECFDSALSLLESALAKYKELKAFHEMDPPVPQYIETIINNNIKILKIMQIKYSIQGGTVPAGDWKKKADEEFGDDISLKLLSLTETLKSQTRKQSNVFEKNPHSSISKNFKETVLQSGYDLVKPFMQVLGKAIKERKQKIEREVDFKKTQNITQQLINQEIKKKREVEEKNTKQSQFKKASASFPLEYHSELIYHAYEVKNSKILSDLLELALLRVECRRIQVPYINDIGVLASATSTPNIPNGYEKIPIDLNQANLKNEIKKLRKKGLSQGGGEEQKKPEPAKEQKKGGKEKVEQKVVNADKDAPTEWQLEQVKHKYVYIIVKRSMNPENAIYKMDIVMGHEEEGPVGYMDTRRIIVPYIQQDMQVKQSEVKQYKGVKQSSHLVPYIVLHHTKQDLENDSEKRTIITDVQPVIGKSPMVPSNWGYHKVPIDLRQVPAEFIQNSVHDYVYLSYKNDETYYNNSRQVKILNALNQLQNSATSDKANSIRQEKLLQLGISFDLQKLKNLFQVMEECLEGLLGQEYYKSKLDFLTNLSFYIWTKYLREPLIQFDYVNEMKLNDQIVQYDYEHFRQFLRECKPIFLSGFKILNLILINNQRSDILFLSRVNLELVKSLEEEQQYKIAGENAKMCMDRIRLFRDQYLSKSVQGNQDKLLPFSLTCSNNLVKDTITKMKDNFKKQRNQINKLKRIKKRASEKTTALTEEQLEEQESEYLFYEKKDQIDEVIDKATTQHSHLISIVMAIQLDITNLYFRVMLKNAQQRKKQEILNSGSISNGIKQAQLEGLASSMKQKLKLPEAPSEVKNKKNLKELQTTLINAEKMSPSKPGLHHSQKALIQYAQKNPYLFSLLMANFAAMNSQSEEKKYYLKESIEHIQKCFDLEKQQCDQAVEKAIFIFSTLWDDQIHPEKSSNTLTPFQQLYDGTWPAESFLPSEPILISKSSSFMVMKHPPYKPSEKKKKMPKYMSLFGKPAANGVDVSHNCNELEGTGIKNKIDEVVRVTNLKPNNIYVYATAATNNEDELQPIGKTGKQISTCHPLPIPMLAAYLAKISYQINEFEVAENAAKIIVQAYCEKSKYQTDDERINNIYFYKFNENSLNNVSLLEVRSISECLYVLALCERRKLKQMEGSAKFIAPIILQQKQKYITNLLVLSSLLNPSLTAPISSIPFLIPDSQVVLKALSLTLIPQKWMNSKLKKLGVKVMQRVMKWGLQKNQISLARRILYKWGERKWIMLGKTIQVEEKKDAKKGGKESKEQEVKMIDKYCRMLVEKSNGTFDLFEDSTVFISEQYSDYVSMFVERAKQQISYFTSFVDNPPEELQQMTSNLSTKLELTEYLKDPINSIKKVPESSPFYLEYNCKILKKALEVATQAQYKTLETKMDQLTVGQKTPELALESEILQIMKQAVSNDIEWSPSAKQEYIRLQQKTGKNLEKQIQLFTNYEKKYKELTQKLAKMDSFHQKSKDFDYLNLWYSELNYLKAVIMIINCKEFEIKSPVKGRYEKVAFMNLTDLLKKWKEVEVSEKENYTLKGEDLQKINKIMNLLCQSAFSCYLCQNWIKLQNIFKIVFNFITAHLLTPFSHKQNPIWSHFSFLSILAILMLEKVKRFGFQEFKNRYDLKMGRTQMKIIAQKLELPLDEVEVVDIFEPVYYLPFLDPNTTKNFWFEKEPRIDLQTISSLVVYTIQTLRIQNKYNLVINIARDFCNATQHYYSLEFLPFMIESQSKLRDEIKLQLDGEIDKLNELTKEFTKKKGLKMKGERQHKLTNQPLPYEVQYNENKRKVNESMELLSNQNNFIQSQMEASQRIIDQIKRDTSKTVIKQREQRKFMHQFGEDEEHMFKNYGEDTRLAKNRKNAIKDIIEQYQKIYRELKNSKTSKDTLAQIQNRNDVGNLYFALGSSEKAEEFWDDALATIFKKVHPIDNFVQVLNQRKVYLVNTVGEKQVLLALNLLYKVSCFGAFRKLNVQQKSMEFACHLGASLYQVDGNHPQNLAGHAKYRMTKLSNKDNFADQTTLNLSVLLSSLEYFSLRAIDFNKSINCLPLLTLYEFISTDIVKNVECSMKSKILKAIALSESGFISQAIFYLAKAFNEKDLPNIWIDPSDNLNKQKGKNWVFEGPVFDNTKNWTEAENKQAIQFVKKLVLKPEFGLNYGLINPILFNYAKGKILFKIHETQVHGNYQTNEIRIQNVQQSEGIMRECLKKLSILHQHYENLQIVETARIKFKQNQVSQEIEKQYKEAQGVMVDYLKASGIEDVLLKCYQQEKSTIVKKLFRVQLMARMRFSIQNSHACRRLFSNCFFILKNGLQNLSRYSYGMRKVQSGQDPEIQPVQQQPPPGKKQQKKGAKKEEQKAPIIKPEVDEEKEKQLRNLAQNSQTRVAINAFWCLKMNFQIGKLMYQQNRFTTAINVFTNLIKDCEVFEEEYYKIYAQGYIQRCLLKLGKYSPQQIISIINEAENKNFQGKLYIDLVMDFGELVNTKQSLSFYEKGKEVSEHLWKQIGMKSILLGLAQQNPQRVFSGKDELTGEQEQLIKRKGKKGDKKGGKEEKKAPKKEDPKKKKEDNKQQYKVKPLSTFEWWNLLDEEKQSFENYVLKPHPDLHLNNIYISHPLNFIKCFIRCVQLKIEHYFEEQILKQTPFIEKLITIIDTYPNITHYYQIHLYFILAEMNKKNFIHNLNALIKEQNTSKLKLPFEDVPLNNQLIKLPSYSSFIFKNRKYLVQAQKFFHKAVNLVKNNSLLLENGFRLDSLLWKTAETQGYLAQYRGRLIPKYCPIEITAEAQQSDKLQYLNTVSSMAHHLDLSGKIANMLEDLSVNYCELGNKPLQANVKIDQDIINQIIDIDRQFKTKYPKFLADSIKEKVSITSVELIAFMIKLYREAEFFTFSNLHIQNLIFKCHRILLAGLPTYKEKCIIASTEFIPKKSVEEKFVEKQNFVFKSFREEKCDKFLYILGGIEDSDSVYYGKMQFNRTELSAIMQQLYRIRSKMLSSQKKSESVKTRDYIIYRKDLDKVLLNIGKRFNPKFSSLQGSVIELKVENLTLLIKMLQNSGTKSNSKEITGYLRRLHELKYKLVEEKIE